MDLYPEVALRQSLESDECDLARPPDYSMPAAGFVNEKLTLWGRKNP
jgi:hypothetical protein